MLKVTGGPLVWLRPCWVSVLSEGEQEHQDLALPEAP